ncbi:MAG: GNAT family protein [Corynebacterium sp.]|uniref:GNAT family N-acetyltransferase n=1 Tax=Corynebacterium sp. TaxID=1720 RepID=UPI0026DAA284|nr:GNAT family protein [Corynebacterium sp.]MDO4761853.1 GNAT family protein [Corynebacterium sp.]
MDDLARFWPPFGITITVTDGTRTLDLRVTRDDDLVALSDVQVEDIYGTHRPDYAFAWLNAPYPQRVTESLKFRWSHRAELTTDKWSLDFIAFNESGDVVGGMDMRAADFSSTRTADTGSWVFHKYQGQGYGSLMRHALAQLAFDHLGITRLKTGWHYGNSASAKVSEKLGYEIVESTETSPVFDGSMQPISVAVLSKENYQRGSVTTTITGITAELKEMLGCVPTTSTH